MENNWDLVLNKMEKFLYGENGIETIFFSDPNFDRNIIDIEEVIEILKMLKQIENTQNRI